MFVLSANFHAGAELVNYPWDRWLSIYHADNDWFDDISRAYADTAHVYSEPGYMSDMDNGVTRGSVWYVVYGGRQDFVTQELHGREVTIELDYTHITPASQLPILWENNWRSLLGYLENALYGIHGMVFDSQSYAPVGAKVFIQGHDKDSSHVYSDTLTGSFVRLLSSGTWPLTFTASDYRDTTISVSVLPGQKTEIILYMERDTSPPDTTLNEVSSLYPNPASSVINAVLPDAVVGNVSVLIFNSLGALMAAYDTEVFSRVPLIINLERLSPGTYQAVFTNSKKKTSARGRFVVIK
jgi:Zinc carboxypeptidase/Secretion system C-terminal sorting domain